MKSIFSLLFIAYTGFCFAGNFVFTEIIEWKDSASYYYYNDQLNSKITDKIPLYTIEVNIGSDDFIDVGLDENTTSEFLEWNSAYVDIGDEVFFNIEYEKKSGSNFAIISFPLIISRNTSSGYGYKTFTLHVNSYSNTSILNTGEWVKVRVGQSGVYKITYNNLLSYGFDSPASVRVFGASSGELSSLNSQERDGGLVEIPIKQEFGADGSFGTNDYILFYGYDPNRWSYNENTNVYEHSKHSFTDYSYYFITVNNGIPKTISSAPTTINSEKEITEYDEYYFYEQDDVNIIKSGSEWFESFIDKEITFSFQNVNTSKEISAYWNIYIGATKTTSYSVSSNGTTLGTYNVAAAPGGYGNKVTLSSENKSFLANNSLVKLSFNFNNYNVDSKAYLDYVCIAGRSKLKKNDTQLHFRDSESLNYTNVSYKIEAKNDVSVWDITDYNDVKAMQTSFSNGASSFKSNVSGLREFVAFNNSEVFSPEFVKTIENQNLHGITDVDFLIIAHNDFLDYAKQVADLHEEIDGFNTKIVTQYEIFNEFSGGKPDVSAIRDFIKHVYLSSVTSKHNLKYVLFYGDGSYDNRSITEDDVNILTYQSKNSISISKTYTSDDFFGLLEYNEGIDKNGTFIGDLDIGIGRFPVDNINEAKIVAEKTVNYAKNPKYRGSWQNDLCFIADDLDGGTFAQPEHTEQANNLADQINSSYPFFNFEKIFCDAYKQESTASGERYPDVNKKIQDRLKKGTLIMNYTGHRSEKRFAAENIVNENELLNWDNATKLPLFITASCEISRFDDYSTESIGEKILLYENGGAIALLSTTRVVYSSDNYKLNSTLFKFLFTLDENNKAISLGEAIRLTKNNSGTDFNQNSRSFILLGDPALRLAVPELRVVVDSINAISINDQIDTIGALSHVKVTGQIQDVEGTLLTKTGNLKVTLFDKKSTVLTLGNDGYDPIEFNVQNSILFKGNVSVEAGMFSFDFILPKDISYVPGNGKFSFYYQDDVTDGTGTSSDFIISGSSVLGYEDFDGPEINLFMNDTTFVDGQVTDENPVLMVKVFDESGINISDIGIGHNATAVFDYDFMNQQVLNEFYEAEADSYQKGEFLYPYSDLELGEHTITVKIWDILNNSTERDISFIVTASTELLLYDLINYPNPVSDHTYFQFKHNQQNQNLYIEVCIYTLQGRLVTKLDYEFYATGYLSEPLYWDAQCSPNNQPEKGMYLYKIRLENENGDVVEQSEKLILLK